MQDIVQLLVTDFWRGLGIVIEKTEIIIDGEDINIYLKTPDSALIIGMHGKSLEYFNHLLGRMIEKSTGAFVHVHLEVNDYMKMKDERLFRFLDSKIGLIMSTGKNLSIPNLGSYDRKKAHNYIADKNIKNLSTHSEGSGGDRLLILKYDGEVQSSSSSQKITPNAGSSINLADLSEDGIGI